MSEHTTAQHPSSAEAYLRHGWSLVPIPPGRKGPTHIGWQHRDAGLKSSADLPPGYGIGLAHAYSNTMALDIDDWATASNLLMLWGINIQALYDAPDAVVIDSGNPGHGKLLYQMPDGLVLPSKKLTIKADDGRDHNYLDFRCATANGSTVQDVLPPSIHPATNQPYRWAGKGHWTRLPVIPDPLLDLWRQMLAEEPEVAEVKPEVVNWAEVVRALGYISPDCARQDWIAIGMALHHAGVQEKEIEKAFKLWDEWSAKSTSKYPGQKDMIVQWRSFSTQKQNKVTIGSLFHFAIQKGFQRQTEDILSFFKANSQPSNNPLDISGSPLPFMDLDLFPDPLKQRALDVSESVGCDPLVPLFAGLAVVCGAMDSRSRLELMPGYQVPPVLWLMTVGNPSDKKTPGSAPMVGVLEDLEVEDIPSWRTRLLDWEGQEAAYAAAKRAFLEAASNPETLLGAPLPPVPDLPPQPQPLRIKVSDITSQKLVRYAADRPRGMLCYLDEMNAWIRKISDKTSVEDRSAWVQSYEAKRYEYDRVSGGAIISDCFAVAIFGNVQPLVFKSAVQSLATDGLLQRFVPAILNSKLTRRGEPKPEHKLSEAAWDQTIRLIYSLPPQTYTLAPDAFDLFRDFQTWFESAKHDEVILDSDPTFLTAFGKLEGTTARLALICHVIESPFSTVVSRATMERAISVTRNYIIPALRYSLTTLINKDSLERWIANWLIYHAGAKPTVLLSDIKSAASVQLEKYQNVWQIDRVIMSIMDNLERHFWVARADDGSREHHHYAAWVVHPRLGEVFRQPRLEIIEARQRAEDERRRIAKIPRRAVPYYEELQQTGT